MIRAATLLAVLMFGVAAAPAGESACGAPEAYATSDFAVQKTAAAARRKQIKIVIFGTSSSMSPARPGAPTGYPDRFEAGLAKLLPGVAVKLISFAKPRQTAAEMLKAFGPVLSEEKPDLVIWQSGIVDAIRGIDPDQYHVTLTSGLALARAAGADVILMNTQFSPRTESMIAVTPYSEALRWVALQNEVPLFDRFAIMKYWHDNATFDLYAPDKRAEVAERIHQCIGLLLADYVAGAIKLANVNTPAKDAR